MKISRCFTYKTFNPNINRIEEEIKTSWKEVDAKTTRVIKRYEFFQHLCLWLWFPLFIASITFACIADNGGGFVCVASAICCVCTLGFISYQILACEDKSDALKDCFCEINFDDERAECEAYNIEQEKIALEWRQIHPFEEKIRMAKERGSSVDIAEMIKHYEEYIKK